MGLRIFLFLSLLVSIYYLITVVTSLWFFITATVIILFAIIIRYHQKLNYNKDIAQWMVRINEDEMERLSGNLKKFPDGLQYLDKNHPYAFDLDIFGSPSLYQWIDRSNTPRGKQVVIDSLLNLLPSNLIMERRENVKALSHKLKFRQTLDAAGKYWAEKDKKLKNAPSHEAIEKWVTDQESSRYDLFLKILNIASPVLLATLIAMYSSYAYQLVLTFIFFNYLFMVLVVNRINTMTKEVTGCLNLIRSYKQLIEIIENESFDSSTLEAKRQKFFVAGESASRVFKKLEAILHSFSSRSNMMYLLINGVLLLDIFWYFRALKWKQKYASNVLGWIEEVAQWEALASQAAYAYAHPEYCWPTLSEAKAIEFKASNLGHPLIDPKKCVTNDFNLQGRGKVGLITGSNMSGKSTFLRTVGLATTMAQMGLPVCARQFQVSPVHVFTGMRTQDDLGESVSSFYAELKRIKGLLELVEQEIPVLYLLDEILKGTNSDDRHKGSLGLIEQLMESTAFGLISTHDLALGKLSDTYEKLENYSFNSQLKEGQLIFNYKLQSGICHTFNASVLMEKMGIIKSEMG